MLSREMQRRLKELAAALKADPGSIPRRLELAAALRDAGRPHDSIDLYRGIAEVYATEGRLVQAMAVCKGILEIDPHHRETLEMLATLTARRAARKSTRMAALVEPRPSPAAADDDDTSETVPFTPIDPAAEITRPEVDVGEVDEDAVDEPAPGDDLVALLDAVGHPRQLDTERDLRPPDLSDFLEAASELVAPMAGSSETRIASPSARSGARPRPSEVIASGGLSWSEEEGQVIEEALSVPQAAAAEQAPQFPLFADLPRPALVELLGRLTPLKLAAGETIVRENEVGEAFYLICSGSVRVAKGGTELALLGPGEFFGEFAVLADKRRHASVHAVEAVELLEVRRSLLDELVASHPGVARTLRKSYRERLVCTLLKTAPLFRSLSEVERLDIADRFRPRRFGRGARIIDHGAPGSGLFLILVGEVQVVMPSPNGEVVLGSLGEGSYFGEMSLLRGAVAAATVRASKMTEAVQLPPRDFYEVFVQHPELWSELREEMARREHANRTLLSGSAPSGSSGSSYLV
jgi:CRP-like cAMP-binding protein